MDRTDFLNLMSKQPDPVERLAADQAQAQSVWFTGAAGGMTDLFLKAGKRLVALECGHYAITRALSRAKCRRCGEMIRAGWDYDAFRNHSAPDTFSWANDPLRELHEGREE